MPPDRIDLDPSVLAGKPIVRGTRISVSQILDHLAAGWTNQDIIDNYPRIEIADIQACIRYASRIIEEERIYPLKAV